MRMKMTGAKSPEDYTADELFPPIDVKGRGKFVRDEPHRTKIIIHNDLHWDRQFPHFAKEKRFAERLGIDFVTDPDLDLTVAGAHKAPKSWADMAKSLHEAERKALQTRTAKDEDERENVRVMVAADWHSFPLPFPRVDAEDAETAKARNEDLVQRWTDVVVTNLYTGNGLIGPSSSGFSSARPRSCL